MNLNISWVSALLGRTQALASVFWAAKYACLLAFAGMAIFSTGCMVGPKYKRPAAIVPPAYKEQPPVSFKESKGWKQAQPSDSVIRGKWWEIYGDPELNALEEQVSISNQNVLAAEAQFREAREAVQIARAALFPVLTTGPGITNSRTSGTLSNNTLNTFTSGTRTQYALPFDLSYTADIWGSIRRSVTESAETAQVTAAQLENARLSYQANLAADYFQLHGTDGDQELLDRTVKSYEEYLQLTRNRFNGGVASGADVAQAETQVDTARAQLIDLGVARAQFEHAIAILVGKPPAGLTIRYATIKSQPPAIPVGVPSTLLERRPDIAAAERQMASINEEIGIAQAAYYPTLTLSASAGLESSDFLKLFTWPSRFWSVGPLLTETLFDAGRRRALVEEAGAAYDVTVASYRQIVLTAFQQVEDNLSALRVLENEAQVEDQAVQAAERALAISTDQYKAGTASYLQVITSQTTALQDERTAVDLHTRRMVASVLLIQALGGGWDASTLPTVKDLTAKIK
ncbi:MAG: efflux transporter outer membrane subunit [Bryobacteraceae bacterium]